LTRFINVSQVIALYGAAPLIVSRSPGVDNPATFAIQTKFPDLPILAMFSQLDADER